MPPPRPRLLGPTSALFALAPATQVLVGGDLPRAVFARQGEELAHRLLERRDATGADGADVASARSATR